MPSQRPHLVWVVNPGHGPVGLLDVVLAAMLVQAQRLVMVLAQRDLELLLSLTE